MPSRLVRPDSLSDKDQSEHIFYWTVSKHTIWFFISDKKSDLPYDFLSVSLDTLSLNLSICDYTASEVPLLDYVTPIFIGLELAHTIWFFIAHISQMKNLIKVGEHYRSMEFRIRTYSFHCHFTDDWVGIIFKGPNIFHSLWSIQWFIWD